MILAFLAPRTFSMLNLSADIKKLLVFGDTPSVLLTVGNPLRSDDGVGPYVAANLSSTKTLMVIDARYNPENVIDDIVSFKPKRILVIDAADFKGSPGQVRLIDSRHIPETTLSTHSIPLSVVAGILVEDTGATLDFLGIQAKNVAMGEELSREVREAAETIISYIKERNMPCMKCT
jgi:hydrogenase 3 maturation protease